MDEANFINAVAQEFTLSPPPSPPDLAVVDDDGNVIAQPPEGVSARDWIMGLIAERDEARAEVDHWKSHAEEAGAGFARVCKDWNRANARNRELRATLAEVLGQFRYKTNPGRPCRQSGHVAVETLAKWHAALATPEPAVEQRCSTCFGTGLVEWGPFEHRDSEEHMQPCPDCRTRDGKPKFAVDAGTGDAATEAGAVARCPRCRHQPHEKTCFNIQSDNDCACTTPTETKD